MSKPFLSFEEQLQKLENRNLKFLDRPKALNTLKKVNYQKLLEYRRSLIKSGYNEENYSFKEESTFEELYKLFLFDNELRSLILKFISLIEIEFRTKIAYYFALNTEKDILCHLKKKYFKKDRYHDKFLKIIEKELEKKEEHKHGLARHHQKQYPEEELPIYKVVELLTFGQLSRFYKNLETVYQKLIIADLKERNPKTSFSNTVIISWLEVLTNIRNMCAHNEVLWDKEIKNYKELNQDVSWKRAPQNKIFKIFLMFKLLLEKEEFNKFTDQLVDLLDEYDIDKELMGFPETWKEDLNI